MKTILIFLFCVSLVIGQVFFGEDVGASSLGPNSIAARNSFVAALGDCSVTFDFENQPVGAPNLVLAPGITLTTTDGDFVSNNPTQPQALFGFATSGVKFYQAIGFGGDITFSFTTPQMAFGAYFTGVQPAIGGNVVITFHDSTTQSFNLPGPVNNQGGVEFWGFISSTPFLSVSLQERNDIYGIDDVIINAGCLCPGKQSAGRFFIVTPLNNQIAGSGPSQCQIGVNYTEAILLCHECGGSLADIVFSDYLSSALSSLTLGFETCNDGTQIYKSFYINSYNGNTYGVPIDLTYPAITASSPSTLRGVLCQV